MAGHEHEPDPRSARIAEGATWIIDFNCIHCGRSGSVEIDPKNIDFGEEEEDDDGWA